jgi:flagellar hook assembly protein FlgD
VTLAIYDLGGHRLRTLVDADLAPGSYSEAWDGRDDAGRSVAAGSYMYVLGTGDWNRSQRMVLVK